MNRPSHRSRWRLAERRLALNLPRLTLQADLDSLADSMLGMRTILALDSDPSLFPIHREIRFAVRRPLDEVFDDLALRVAPRAQRLAAGAVIFEGEGFFASATGRRKTYYSSGTICVWAHDFDRLREVEAHILRAIGDQMVREEQFTIDWYFHGGHSGLTNVSFEELADPALIDEAYPSIEGGVSAFIERYLEARDTILVLQGPPGTGKTRLVRAILAAMSRRKRDNAIVMYTADRRAIDNDEIFVEFLTGAHDALVIEDADHLLGARANGNPDLHRFLTVADGVVQALGRKIVFTTNLHNIGDIDDALIRPGRCFAVVRTRGLSREEARRFLAALAVDRLTDTSLIVERALSSGSKTATLAELYRAIGTRC
ncbi:MAG: AAA family ATPase [Steroidobacteraceae bacterium]